MPATFSPDGRIAFFGGHYIDGDNGIRKINIFNPETETWVDRGVPRSRRRIWKGFLRRAPRGFPGCRGRKHGDPPHPSDMKYQRWYPSAAVLPNGKVLIHPGPIPSLPPPARTTRTTPPRLRSTIRTTDTTIALENARKVLPNYPLTYVVQTGPGLDDWKVAVTGEMVDEEGAVLAHTRRSGARDGAGRRQDVLPGRAGRPGSRRAGMCRAKTIGSSSTRP